MGAKKTLRTCTGADSELKTRYQSYTHVHKEIQNLKPLLQSIANKENEKENSVEL